MEHTSTLSTLSPFDDGVTVRHQHMGLLLENGSPNLAIVKALAIVHAGLFFDHLCDSCGSGEKALEICSLFQEQLDNRAGVVTPKRLLLMLSMQYDMMQRPMPEVIWWLSGTQSLLEPFLTEFFQALHHIAQKEQSSQQR